MKYTMYHKNLPTITFNLTERGYVDKVFSIENENHIHPYLLIDGKVDDRDGYYSLYDNIIRWMEDRNIPASRKNLSSALAALGVKSSTELSRHSFYLSLSDHYWIAPTELNLDWDKINFFSNPFSEDVGAAFFGEALHDGKLNLHSPDPNTAGQLTKKWVIEYGKRILVKGGSGTEQLEPFNEVLATEICHRLGISCVDYELYFENRKHFCKCRNYADENTECISAAEICEDLTDFKSGFVSYDDFKKRCGLLGIPLDEKELGKMFVLDYLIANGDRHLNNFGFLRDSDTLEWKGLCPVYDSGSSMFYDKVDFEIDSRIGISERGLLSKPFSDNYVKQLLLFPFVDCIREMPLERLRGIGDFYKDLLSKNERNIPREKIDRLAEVIQCRAEMLGEFKDARSVSDLPVVRKFLENLDGVSSADNFKEFVQEKYRKVTENDDIKKELLSFYLYGLNSKSEKDFERKIKQFVNRREIDIDGYGR